MRTARIKELIAAATGGEWVRPEGCVDMELEHNGTHFLLSGCRLAVTKDGATMPIYNESVWGFTLHKGCLEIRNIGPGPETIFVPLGEDSPYYGFPCVGTLEPSK